MAPNQAAHIVTLIKSQNCFCRTFLWAICVGITQNPNLLYRVENVFMYYYNTVVNWGISVNIILLNISQVHAIVLYLHNWQATIHSNISHLEWTLNDYNMIFHSSIPNLWLHTLNNCICIDLWNHVSVIYTICKEWKYHLLIIGNIH